MYSTAIGALFMNSQYCQHQQKAPTSQCTSNGFTPLRCVLLLGILNDELERLERKWSWGNRGSILAFSWMQWEKPRMALVKISGSRTEIRSEHLTERVESVTCRPSYWVLYSKLIFISTYFLFIAVAYSTTRRLYLFVVVLENLIFIF
jgi:hypothetical protein